MRAETFGTLGAACGVLETSVKWNKPLLLDKLVHSRMVTTVAGSGKSSGAVEDILGEKLDSTRGVA